MPRVGVIDANGEISLGEAFAGRAVVVEEREPAVWLVRVVPEHERWLHGPEAAASLQRAFAWAVGQSAG